MTVSTKGLGTDHERKPAGLAKASRRRVAKSDATRSRSRRPGGRPLPKGVQTYSSNVSSGAQF
eukprot:6232030-Pyramimonas_sp.AAC.1